MRERTEEEVFSKTPQQATLGSVKYDFKPLPIMKTRAWRAKLTEIMHNVVGTMSVPESEQSIGPALTAALVAFPDKVLELVFAWSSFVFVKDEAGEITDVKFDESACELPKHKILTEATEEQLGEAFKSIMVMAYPFLAHLAMAVQVTKSQLK